MCVNNIYIYGHVFVSHTYIHIGIAATLADVDKVVPSNPDAEQHYTPALHINRTHRTNTYNYAELSVCVRRLVKYGRFI